MKRIIGFVLTLALCFSVIGTETYAIGFKDKKIPPGLSKKKILPSGITKRLNEIKEKKISEDINEGTEKNEKIKAIIRSTYLPRKPITHIRALIMVLNIMGYENETEFKEIIKEKNIKIAKEWIQGNLDAALDYGIINGEDYSNINLIKPVKRYELAKYLVKALELEDEAEESIGEKLQYKDASAIPGDSMGYIYVLEQRGIMKGYNNNTYRPKKPVTRSEMLAVLKAIKEFQEKSEEIKTEYEGKVVENKIDENKIKINVDNTEMTFVLSDEIVVEFTNKTGNIEDIRINDEAKIKLNSEKKIEYMVINRDLKGLLKGDFVAIDETKNQIIIKNGTEYKIYNLNSDVVVEINGEIYGLSDLEPGDKLELDLQNEKVVKIFTSKIMVKQ